MKFSTTGMKFSHFLIILLVIVLICLFFILIYYTYNNTTAPETSEVVRGELGVKLDTYLTRSVPYGFSGGVLVAKNEQILLNKGYGLAIRRQRIPCTSQTVFSTGSITKQFTAAGIMKLEMMGKLNTSDPISKYLGDLPDDKRISLCTSC
ncbi:MAG: serine hydrolase [Candidatus Aminicenantes bacterium]|nr:serine hydrolase [Candidatus Aminicenantes bacterium]